MNTPKTYTLIGADGRPYESAVKGTLGGHRRIKGYGRLDCPSALRWIAKGHYVRHRVFFADEATAIAAGYRPCAICCPQQYQAWKAARTRGAPPPAATRGSRSTTAGSGRTPAAPAAAGTITDPAARTTPWTRP